MKRVAGWWLISFIGFCIAMVPLWAHAKEVPDKIRIGAPVPISGKFAAGARTLKIGYEIGIDTINKAGGVYLKEYDKKLPLQLIILDDESDPVKTVAKMESLKESEKVVAYFGGFGSSLHAAAAAIAEKNRIPYLGVAFTLYSIHQQGYHYLFSPFPKTPNSIKSLFALLETLPADKRPTRMALFELTTDWGIEQAKFIKKFAPPEYEVVTDAKYRPLTKDFTSMILKAKAARANSLWSNPIPPDGIALIRQSKEMGWSPDFRYIVRASSSTAWPKALGPSGDGAICDAPYHWSLPFPGNKEFVAEYEKRDGIKPDMVAGAAYACVQILAESIERAGGLDPKKLRDAVAATNMVTIMGPIKFNKDGTPQMYDEKGNLLPIAGMAQWQNGKQELIWPLKYATAGFIYPVHSLK